MAARKDIEYPGRWLAATPAYPMGEPKNRTTSTSKDGSYLEKKWIQDYEAFFGALLNEAGVSPNGTVDTAESSQFFGALTTKIQGESSLSQNGYQKLDNGLIIQWGRHPVTASSGSVLTPIAFPNEVFTVVGAPTNNDSTVELLTITSLSLASFSYATYSATTGAAVISAAAHPFNWIAIGI